MITEHYAQYWDQCDNESKVFMQPLITSLANNVVREIKGEAVNFSTLRMNWVDIKGFRHMLQDQKDIIVSHFNVVLV